MLMQRTDGTLRPADRTDFRRALTPGATFTAPDGVWRVAQMAAGDLRLPSGRIIAADPWHLGEGEEPLPFGRSAPPGRYPVRLALARHSANPRHERVACMVLELSAAPAVAWQPALRPGERLAELPGGQFYGHSVDSGLTCFVDATAAELPASARRKLYRERIFGACVQRDERAGAIEALLPGAAPANLIACVAGHGDGVYPSWWGYDETGAVCALATDFQVLVEEELGEARFPLDEWADRMLQHPDLLRIGVRAWLPPAQPGDRTVRVVIDGAEQCEAVVEDGAGRVIGAGGAVIRYGNRVEHRLSIDEPLPEAAVLVLTYALGVRGL